MNEYLDLPPTEVILTQLGISYESKGVNQFITKCPFHDDHTPSLSIQKEPLLYHCFACGAKGNWYSLIKNLTGINPYKFLKIESTKKPDISFLTSLKTYENNKSLKKEKLKIPEFKIVAETIHPFDDEEAKQYCLKRNIEKSDIEKYDIFYIKRGYINNTNFFNRLVIPVKDESGFIVSYEGRDTTGEAKKKCVYPYLSKVGNTIFQNQTLDRTKHTIFVEGILDLIVVQKALPKVQVSTYFGIQLSNIQIDIVEKFNKIITMFDPDKAGLERGNLILNEALPKKEFEVCILENNDPNESSFKEIQKAYNNRINLTEFHLRLNGLLQPKQVSW